MVHSSGETLLKKSWFLLLHYSAPWFVFFPMICDEAGELTQTDTWENKRQNEPGGQDMSTSFLSVTYCCVCTAWALWGHPALLPYCPGPHFKSKSGFIFLISIWMYSVPSAVKLCFYILTRYRLAIWAARTILWLTVYKLKAPIFTWVTSTLRGRKCLTFLTKENFIYIQTFFWDTWSSWFIHCLFRLNTWLNSGLSLYTRLKITPQFKISCKCSAHDLSHGESNCSPVTMLSWEFHSKVRGVAYRAQAPASMRKLLKLHLQLIWNETFLWIWIIHTAVAIIVYVVSCTVNH